MHLDPQVARRTQAGALVVHGIHALLWSLDQLYARFAETTGSQSLRVDFKQFVQVGQEVSLFAKQTPKGWSMELRTLRGVATSMKLGPDPLKAPAPFATGLPVMPHAAAPLEPDLDGMRHGAGRLVAPQDGSAAAFPAVTARLSAEGVAAMTQLSRLVGMVCPGLHSVFSSVNLTLAGHLSMTGADRQPGIGFRTAQADERTSMVTMEVEGAGLAGSVLAFIRPQPVTIADTRDLSARVRPDQYADRVALVVGGSRGIGATTAKLIAAGGGRVIVTYAVGAADAQTVAEDINAATGRIACTVARFDVAEPAGPQLDAITEAPTHIYYNATPSIFVQKSPAFDAPLFQTFLDFYVRAFNDLCVHFAERQASPLTVVYPSSVAVEKRPLRMTEYAMAKAAGEILCDDLMKMYRHVTVRRPRLPRTLTDQTATIAHAENEDPVAVALGVLDG